MMESAEKKEIGRRTTMEDRTLLDFLAQAEKLKCNTRHSWTSSDRHESVAEHSWRLVLMAYLMKDEFPDTDIAKVMLMCAVHDLGEAVTGDIPAFEKTKADEKVEEKAVAGLFDTLPEPYHAELDAALCGDGGAENAGGEAVQGTR